MFDGLRLALPPRRKLLERLAADRVARQDGHVRAGLRAQRRGALAVRAQQRHLAEDRPRPDLEDLLAVRLDDEHAVEEHEEVGAGLALLDERLALLQPAPPHLAGAE